MNFKRIALYAVLILIALWAGKMIAPKIGA